MIEIAAVGEQNEKWSPIIGRRWEVALEVTISRHVMFPVLPGFTASAAQKPYNRIKGTKPHYHNQYMEATSRLSSQTIMSERRCSVSYPLPEAAHPGFQTVVLGHDALNWASYG